MVSEAKFKRVNPCSLYFYFFQLLFLRTKKDPVNTVFKTVEQGYWRKKNHVRLKFKILIILSPVSLFYCFKHCIK